MVVNNVKSKKTKSSKSTSLASLKTAEELKIRSHEDGISKTQKKSSANVKISGKSSLPHSSHQSVQYVVTTPESSGNEQKASVFTDTKIVEIGSVVNSNLKAATDHLLKSERSVLNPVNTMISADGTTLPGSSQIHSTSKDFVQTYSSEFEQEMDFADSKLEHTTYSISEPREKANGRFEKLPRADSTTTYFKSHSGEDQFINETTSYRDEVIKKGQRTAINSTIATDIGSEFSADQQEVSKRVDTEKSDEVNYYSNHRNEVSGFKQSFDEKNLVKNLTAATTTYTSKVYDDKTHTWRVVDESVINENDSLKENLSTSKMLASKQKKSVKNVSETKTESKTSTETSTTKATKSTNVSKQIYDERTHSWKGVSDEVIKTIRPSLVRYVSKESDGSFTTIYKRKVFDQKTGRWKVVDEKIIKSKSGVEPLPEIIDDVTNITTTTYTTKVFDSATGTWKVVEEKSYVDSKAIVPNDIVNEIEKDKADVANITTTTEITKVFDASTNSWKIVDEKVHTDVLEKIIEVPKEKIYIDENTDIEKIKKITDISENVTDISNITSREDIISIKEKRQNLTDLGEKEKIHYNVDDVITSEDVSKFQLNKISTEKLDHIVDETVNTYKSSDDVDLQRKVKDTRITSTKGTEVHKEQCICEICTCGRHRCTHDKTADHITLKSDEVSLVDQKSVYKDTFTKNVSKFSEIRAPITKPQDNLKPEGDFYAIKATKEDFQEYEVKRQTAIRHEDNLSISGTFTDLTTTKSDFTEHKPELRTPIRRNTWTKVEGEMITDTTNKLEFIDFSNKVEKQRIIKNTDNLTCDGEITFKTTTNEEYTEKDSTYIRPRKRTWTKDDVHKFYGTTIHETITATKENYKKYDEHHILQPLLKRPQDNLKPEGDFFTPEKPGYQPAERPRSIKHEDNLKPEGDFYTPEKPGFTPAEKPKQIKPKDNLKPEGDFYVPEKPGFKPAERLKQVRPEDNLRPEGDFLTPEKPGYRPVERPRIIKHEDNLRPEGDFYVPEKPGFKPAERPKQVRPEDNLRPEGDFYTPEKPGYSPAEKPKQIIPKDNLKPEGNFYVPEKPGFKPAERPKEVRPEDNLRPEGDFFTPEKPGYRPAERPRIIKHEDNLKPEGDFYVPEKLGFKPAERPKEVRPEDNLRPEGDFFTPEKAGYRPAERPQIIKHEDNLRIEGDFYSPDKPSFKPSEKPKQVKPKDNLKLEGELYISDKPDFSTVERPKLVKPGDNLKPEGDFYIPERPGFKPGKKAESVRPVDNLKSEGDFYVPEKSGYRPAERPKIVRHEDNLRPEGDFYTPEKPTFTRAEKPTPVKPADNLKPEGDFYVPDKPDFIPAEKSEQIIHGDNLKLEGEFVKRVTQTGVQENLIQREKVQIIKRKDNLKLEGELMYQKKDLHSKQVLKPAEKFTPITPQDNLRLEGTMDIKRESSVVRTERRSLIKPLDNLHLNGNMDFPEKIDFKPAQKPKVTKPRDNLSITGNFEIKSSSQKSDFTSKKSERVSASKQVDNLKVLGKLDTTTTTSSAFKELPKEIAPVVVQTRRRHMDSSIRLGSDTSIMKTTNQINYASSVTHIKDMKVSSEDKSRTDSKHLQDGTILVTTKKVTTVLGTEKNKAPEKEVIHRGGKVKLVEKSERSSFKKDVINTKDIVEERRIIKREETDHDAKTRMLLTEAEKHTSKDINIARERTSSANISEIHSKSSSAVSSSSQQTKAFHHKKSVLSSEADIANSVFHRKDVSSNLNENLHSTSLSSTGTIQRKSISNLHDQSVYNTSSADRRSCSTIHRESKDLDYRYGSGSTYFVQQPKKIVRKDNLMIGGEFLSTSESRSYGSFANVHKTDRMSVRRSTNQSSIQLGDDHLVSSSLYKREYVKTNDGPCPVTQIHKGVYKHTRDTKEHKFYKPTIN